MPLRDDLDRLAAAYRAGQHLVLLFDYDGALASPVAPLGRARCPDSTAQLLARCSELPRVGVGVLSNRAADGLKSPVRLPKLSYVGPSGREGETKDLRVVHPRAHHYRPYLEHALAALRAVIAPFTGAWLEDKTLALMVHILAVPREDKPMLQQRLDNTLARYDGQLTAVYGAHAVEVLPDIGWAKADTIRQVLESQPKTTLPLYAAGDGCGGQAFQLVARSGGVTIGVGPLAGGGAMHHLPDAESLAHELAVWFNALAGGAPLIGGYDFALAARLDRTR